MATHAPITVPSDSGTSLCRFLKDARAFDDAIDAFHVLLDAEAFAGPNAFDPAFSGLLRDVDKAETQCRMLVLQFLGRPGLCDDHVMAAEHLNDVLASGAGALCLQVAPIALGRAVRRLDAGRDARSVILARQLSHLEGVLRLVSEEALNEADGLEFEAPVTAA